MTTYTCLSVPGGWQTQNVGTGELIGPVFNKTTDLWNWQRDNLPEPQPPAGYTCQQAILDLLHSSGPQHRQDLRRECHTQASPYDNLIFQAAVNDLIASGQVVLDCSDEDPFFDLPPSYYTGEAA